MLLGYGQIAERTPVFLQASAGWGLLHLSVKLRRFEQLF